MDPFTILGLGSAAAGIVGNIIGSGQKASGVAANQAAQAQVAQQQIDSIVDQDKQAHEINQWYTGQSQGLADQTQANDLNTISGADAGSFNDTRATAGAARTATGDALIDGLSTGTNYSDKADDSSGAVKSENARKLVAALSFAKNKAAAGATVNAYGDALLNGGIAIQKGNNAQAPINTAQKRTDAIANMRSNLNQETHVPILSPQAQMDLTNPVGAGQFQNGQLLQTGGNLISALGANGVGQGAFNGLFQGAVPSASATGMAAMGPQIPGLFGTLFS